MEIILDGKTFILSKDGRTVGRHATKEDAEKQKKIIEAAEAKRKAN